MAQHLLPESKHDEEMDYFVELTQFLNEESLRRLVHEALRGEAGGLGATELWARLSDPLTMVARLQLQKALLNMLHANELQASFQDGDMRYRLPVEIGGERSPDAPYRLHVRVREAEFTAEGDEQVVRRQFAAFLNQLPANERQQVERAAATEQPTLPPKQTTSSRGMRPKYDWDRGLALWREGWKAKDIAEALGCATKSVSNAAQRYDWPKRKPGGQNSKAKRRTDPTPLRRCESCEQQTITDPCQHCGASWERAK